MLRLGLPGSLRLLVVGAHADDIEIGSGATILRLLAEHPGSRITWVVASASPERAREARAGAQAFSAQALEWDVHVADLPDGRLPGVLGSVKDLFEQFVPWRPDVILAPHQGDAHQDHRLVAEVIGQTFRDQLILAYEIPKYDGDLGRPNVFVDIDEATLDRKVALLDNSYPSQRTRRWWGHDTFRSLARLRGIEAATQFAEAFYSRKVVL